jgi:proteasome lid subunit RPN8/RPN11
MIPSEILSRIAALAQEAVPEEVCGYIIIRNDDTAKSELIPSNNKVDHPSLGFRVEPDAYLKATSLGSIVALYHSHPMGPEEPSEADVICCNRLQIPFLIYSIERDKFKMVQPMDPVEELLELQWDWENVNCGFLAVRYLSLIHGIELPELTKLPTEKEFPFDDRDFIHECAMAWGFQEVSADDLKPSDVLSVSIYSNNPNSLMVYLGGDTVLHAAKNSLTHRIPLTESMRKKITHVYRHPKVSNA